MTIKVEEGHQFSLPIAVETTDPADQQLADKRRQRKIGLLTRILHSKDDGTLYRDVKNIEDGFKAGSSRTAMYFYTTKAGEQTVEATPEDIKAVLDRRHAKQKVA